MKSIMHRITKHTYVIMYEAHHAFLNNKKFLLYINNRQFFE
jgi:hypothetical protein